MAILTTPYALQC